MDDILVAGATISRECSADQQAGQEHNCESYFYVESRRLCGDTDIYALSSTPFVAQWLS